MTAVVTSQVDITSGQPTEQMQTDGAAHVTIIPTSAENLSNATSTAYEASRVVKASPGTLFFANGFNSGASQFIQVHDSTSLPADGAVPSLIMIVGANANFTINPGLLGRHFENGIVICNSSTGPTKTIDGANCWFDVRYA